MENVNAREGEEEGRVITLSEAGEILHASYATGAQARHKR